MSLILLDLHPLYFLVCAGIVLCSNYFSYKCDKIPDGNHLKEETLILAYGFRGSLYCHLATCAWA